MEISFKKLGFRNFILKTVVFIVIGLAIVLLSLFIRQTSIFNTYLLIPAVFNIDASRTTFMNAILFGLIAFIILSYKKLLDIEHFKFQKHQFVCVVLAMVVFFFQYLYRYLINQYLEFFLQTPILWGIIKIVLYIFLIGILAIAVYGFRFIVYFIKIYKKEIIIFSLITIGFFFLTLLFQNLWMVFSYAISKLLYMVFGLFFKDVIYYPFIASETMTEGGGPVLVLRNFSAVIGKPCSGIDSLLLFTSLYILIYCLDYKRLNKKLAILLFFIGATGMFIVNILRIFLLFIIGAFVSEQFAVGLFHTNVGWILFVIYFGVYWFIVSKFLYTN